MIYLYRHQTSSLGPPYESHLGGESNSPQMAGFFSPHLFGGTCFDMVFFRWLLEGFRDSGSFTKNPFPKTAKWFRFGSTFMMLPKSNIFFISRHQSIHPLPKPPRRLGARPRFRSSRWCHSPGAIAAWNLGTFGAPVSGFGVWHPDIIRELVEDQKKYRWIYIL